MSHQDFSLKSLADAICDGANLMFALGSFAMARRHVQELQIRLQEDARIYLGEHRRCFPSVAAEVGEIFRP